MGYREAHDQRYLDQALAIAEFYTKHPDSPVNNLPYFDFSVVGTTIPEYKDASAGAAAASGLLELANYGAG
jgi:unsaturated chondroitin disaccharide hydrolase